LSASRICLAHRAGIASYLTTAILCVVGRAGVSGKNSWPPMYYSGEQQMLLHICMEASND